MIENIKAKPIKPKNISPDKTYKLQKNNQRQINQNNNECVILVVEDKEKEILKIVSNMIGEEFAIIGSELALINLYDPPKSVDLSYFAFIPEEKYTEINKDDKKTFKIIVYLYDMKKSFQGTDVIMHLIEQWKSSYKQTIPYMDSLSDAINICDDIEYKIGVVTENYDPDRLYREIHGEYERKPDFGGFLEKMYNATQSQKIKKESLIEDFFKRKTCIDGKWFDIDVRLFDKKENDYSSHTMIFEHGILVSST